MRPPARTLDHDGDLTDIALQPARPRAGIVPLGKLSDDKLAARAAAGDAAAFSTIYERYHQALYRYCLSITGSPEDAADALQATMAKALQAIGGQEQAGALKAWLYRIAHNESISVLRARKPQAELDDDLAGLAASADQDAATKARLATLVADLKALPDRQRSALILRELSGLEYAEIAGALDTTPATAKQAVYEARCALQDLAMGRELACETVQRALSDGDGRRLRGRKMRAHLRSCAGCRAFQTAIDGRRSDFQALFPVLPAAGAAAILAGVLGGGGGGGGAAGGGGAMVAAHGARFGLGKIAGVAAAGAATAAVAAGAIAVVNQDVAPPPAPAPASASSRSATPPPKPPPKVEAVPASTPSVDAYGGSGGDVLSGVDAGEGGSGSGSDQATAGATAGGELPFTGAETLLLALGGLALLAMGLALRRAGRAR